MIGDDVTPTDADGIVRELIKDFTAAQEATADARRRENGLRKLLEGYSLLHPETRGMVEAAVGPEAPTVPTRKRAARGRSS